MIVFIVKPAFHQLLLIIIVALLHSGISLNTNNKTHEHILQFTKAEVKSELKMLRFSLTHTVKLTLFYEHIGSPAEFKT